jgi:hypothetical protein
MPDSDPVNAVPQTDPLLVKRMRGFFTPAQWEALMTNVPFQRFVQNSTEKDQELVLAYALEVLRKRPSAETPAPPEGPKN